MAITALPTPPSRSDPANFAARGDALLGALPTLVTEMNAATAEVDADRAAAAASASAALASQNAAATSAGNSSTSSTSSAASAAAALAAAAATQAGLPAQTSTNGKVLRSEQGVATWGPQLRASVQVAFSASSENEIATSSAVNSSSWSKGSNTGTLALVQSIPGPNGLRSVNVPSTGAGNQFVSWSYTPQVGVARTLSIWWRGTSKPAAGFLLYLAYRDAGDAVQYQSLAFSDAAVIADGVWRRYSVTATHQGATVTALGAFVCVDVGAVTLNVADPMLEVAASAGPYVATGSSHALEPNCSYDVSSVNGALTLFLPASGLGIEAGTTVAIKDYGRASSTNNITVDRNGSLIEDAANSVEIDINGAAITLHYATRKGWLIK